MRLKKLFKNLGFMKFIIVIIICYLFLSSCENSIGNDEMKTIAYAGENQIAYVGSFAILDASKSQIVGEKVKLIEWIQDSNNPEELSINAYSKITEKSIIGFDKGGNYKFILRIDCESGNNYTDDLLIIVKSRQTSLIEDVNLEIRIRQRLNYKQGELTIDKLRELDSLSTATIPLKNKIFSLKGIEYCSNLTYLSLGLQSISDLSPLSNLKKLEVLDLNQNYTVEDIGSLNGLINLTKLILYGNPITDISSLQHLTKLKELWLLGDPISNISSLSYLINLETLYADGVGIDIDFISIEPLSNLTKLQYLDIAGRGITDVKPLENLSELILLGLSYNNITDISPLSKLTELQRLYLRSNKILSLNGIKDLKNLNFIDAADNQLKNISALEYLPKIQLIGLDGNKIEDISPIVNNQDIAAGVYLYLINNPLNEISVNEYIPELVERGVTIYWNKTVE